MLRWSAMRIFVAAVLVVVMIVSAAYALNPSPMVSSTPRNPRPAGAISTASLSTTPQLLGSVARQDNGLPATAANVTWRLVLAEDANGFGFDIGNAIPYMNGTSGTYTFTSANERDYANVSALLTNGIDDPMEFVSGQKYPGGPYRYTEGNESSFFPTHPDFIGDAIDSIALVVKGLHIYAVSNTTALEFANYTWQVWGYPIFVAFAPPTDANGAYLFDRNYTNVSVSLNSTSPAAFLQWDGGANQSMFGSSRTWYLNVANISNGNHTYQVWANDTSNNVYHSEVRVLTVAYHYWSVETFGAGSGPSMATSGNGTVYLCYEDTNGYVDLATNTSMGWSVQRVALGGSGFCSIALDHEGRPNIVFGALKYGILNGSSWHFETLSSARPTRGASIAINPVTDQPVVAFYDSAPSQLYLVLKNRTASGTWTASVVDRSGDTGWMPSLAVNSTGIAQIAYTNHLGDLYFATISGGGWYDHQVGRFSVLQGMGRISLALDSSGMPHIAFAGGGPRYGTVGYIGLWYDSLSGKNWSGEEVYPGPTQAVSLVIDAQNHPRIAFSLVGSPVPPAGTLRDLRYAAWNGTWQVDALSHAMNATGVVLSLSPGGVPEIAATSWWNGGGANQGTLEYFTVKLGLFATFAPNPFQGKTSAVFTFDPSGSYDTYFPTSRLQERWDYHGTGVWTGWMAFGPVTNTYATSARYTVYMQLRDPNNVNATTQKQIIVDSIPPVTTALLSGTLGANGWYTSSVVNVTLNATDSLTAVASTLYSLDGGAWTTYTVPFNVTTNGNHTVQYYSTDVVGNKESVNTTSFGIDTSLPTASATLSGTMGNAGWYVSPVQVTLTASVGASGLAAIHYQVDGGSWQTYTAPLTLGDGAHTVEYYATDKAGNVSSNQTLSFKIDSTPPTASISVAGTNGTNGWLISTATVTLSATDAGSGVTSINYSLDGGATQTYTGPLTLTNGTHTIGYWATDVAGNREATQSATVKIDTTAPVLTNLSPSGTITASSVAVSWSGSDAGSGIEGYAVSVDSGSFQSVGTATSTTISLTDGAHTITVRATDQAGNTATLATKITVDTNPFSFSGPYRGIPTLALILFAILAGVILLLAYRHRRRQEEPPQKPEEEPKQEPKP